MRNVREATSVWERHPMEIIVTVRGRAHRDEENETHFTKQREEAKHR